MQDKNKPKKFDYYRIIFYDNNGGITEKSINTDVIFSLIEKNIIGLDIEVIAYCINDKKINLLCLSSSEKRVTYSANELLNECNYILKKNLKIEAINFIEEQNILNETKLIHKQSKDWLSHETSSVRGYLFADGPTWLNRSHILDMIGSTETYLNYLSNNIE